MRKLTSPDELAELLAADVPPAWACGLLPDAPPNSLAYIRYLTAREASDAVVAYPAEHNAVPDMEEQQRLCVVAAILVNPAELFLPMDGDKGPVGKPLPVNLAALVPLFEGVDQVGANFDDGIGESVGSALYWNVQQANGYVKLSPVTADLSDLEAYREHLRHRGAWLEGILPQDPEAAVWVAPLTEKQYAGGVTAGRFPWGKSLEGTNWPLAYATIASHICLTGPGGSPLMTATAAMRLPYGGLVAICDATWGLAHGGARAGSFQRADAPADPGGLPVADVVDGDAPAPPAE